MDGEWIETTEALGEWVANIGAGPLALDTEADSFHHYREKVCLVQLSSGGRHALVDPLAGVELTPLAAPLADQALRKILHGADYDVRLLGRDFGIAVSGLSDTMIAARLTGEPAFGLAALLAKHLGVTLDKSHQRADWSKRPLSVPMRAYAIDDTRHLPALAAILDDRLAALGRASWAEEEYARLSGVRWRERPAEDPESFRRTKGSKNLDRAALAVLREVWLWRDGTARRRDRPPFMVLRDETLVALAKSPPHSLGELAKVSGVPESLVRSPAAHDVVEAARRGIACPEAERPEIRVEVREKLAPAVESRVARMKERRDAIARDLALDPTTIASRGVLEEMARRWEDGEDPWSVPELRLWQIGLLRPALT
jgi:ribonuclease D